MRAAAFLALAGCSSIFGLSPPKHAIDAADDAATGDATDAHVDIPDAAPGHCVTQADCPTSVCLPSTMCAADTDVAWLSQTGMAGTQCTMAQPCSRLFDALTTLKPYIRVTGTISNLTSINQSVSIFGGAAGAGFSGNFQLNSGTIALYDLDFTGGNTCIIAKGGTVTAEHITVHDCGAYGINEQNGGSLTIDGSTITRCVGGGIGINSGTFVITNNFITANGTNNSATGGIGILTNTFGAGSRLDFNTIAANNVRVLGSDAGGVYCSSSTFTGVGNVIVHNMVAGSTTAMTANIGGGCQYASSIIQAQDGLGFVSTAANNYHITATSPLRDAATVATGPATDVDGESRPYGLAYDIGADEYHP